MNMIVASFPSLQRILSARGNSQAAVHPHTPHAIEVSAMANTAAQSLPDHGFVSTALDKASAALHEMHISGALNAASQSAADTGDHAVALRAAADSLGASRNAAELAHGAAMDAASAGAPEKVVDLVTSHAVKEHLNASRARASLLSQLAS